jgi:hypothetical protein
MAPLAPQHVVWHEASTWAEIELTQQCAAVAFPDHLLGALRADHPGAADLRLEQAVEVLDGRLLPLHERLIAAFETM